MIKLLHFTDPHADDQYDFSKFQYVRDIANAEKVDAVLCGGDFLYDFDLPNLQHIVQKCHQELIDWISGKDGYFVDIGMMVAEMGGIERLNKSRTPEYKRIADQYAANKTEIESAMRKYANRIKISGKWTEMELDETCKELDLDHRLRCFVLDKILGQIKCPVYAVRGNHDTDRFMNYEWKNLKFFNDVVDVKGLKIASAPNWYENIGIESDYKDMELDIFHGGNVDEKSCEFEILRSKGKQIDLGSIPVYQRLNSKQFDVLLTHKGPHNLAMQETEKGIKHFGSGAALELIIRQAKPKTILAGHVHEPLVVNYRVSSDYSYHGLRGSDKEFFVDYFEENTKRLAEFQRHRWSDVKQKAA